MSPRKQKPPKPETPPVSPVNKPEDQGSEKKSATKAKAMSMAEQLQFLVKAKLMTQEEADQAKRELARAEREGR